MTSSAGRWRSPVRERRLVLRWTTPPQADKGSAYIYAPGNVAPVAQDQAVSTNEDTEKSITLTASDANGDSLTFSVVSGPTNGTLTGTAPNLTYTPDANYNGPDSFTFKANDGLADSNTATVSITVTAVNDAPVANGQSVTTNEDTAKAITLSASDVDGNALTFSVVTRADQRQLERDGPEPDLHAGRELQRSGQLHRSRPTTERWTPIPPRSRSPSRR